MSNDYEVLADGDSVNGDYEILGDGDAPEYSGWSDVPASVAKTTWGGLKNTAGGLLSAIEDAGKYLAVGDSPIANFMLKLGGMDDYTYGENLVEEAQKTLKDTQEQYQFEPWSGSSIANRVGSGVGQMAPIVVGGALTGGTGVIPMIGAQTFGTSYGNAQAEGQSSLDSAYRAMGNAGVDMLAGRANLNAWFKPELGVVRKVIESSLVNAVTDPFQNIANQRINEATGADHVNVEDLNLGESALSSAITGAILPTATHYMGKQMADMGARRSQAEVDAIKAKMDQFIPPETLDVKTSLPPSEADIPQLSRPLADSGPRIIDIQQEQPSGILPVESSARTPDYQAELDAMMRPQTQLITDAQGRPLNTPDITFNSPPAFNLRYDQSNFRVSDTEEYNGKAQREALFDRALKNGQYKEVSLKDGKKVFLVSGRETFQGQDGDGEIIAYNDKGKKVGSLGFSLEENDNGRFNPSVEVSPEWRRLGLASSMYRHAEDLGGLIPDVDQAGQVRTDDGSAFRQAYRRSESLQKEVLKELSLSEVRRKNLEAKALPAIVEPKPAQSLSTNKAINNSSFPKVMEYVQKNMSDKGAQEGFINALKTQREAQVARVPEAEYETKIISDLAKSEFPESRMPVAPEAVSELRKITEQAKSNPGVSIQIMARPALGEARPVHIEHSKVSDVAVNPELFQLRHEVTGKYGTKKSNKIHGQWDDGKSQAVMVYEPIDANKSSVSLGKKQVVSNGHHRHEGADERGVESYTKMVFKESDGWTIDEVKLYGAETNLSQGSTSSIDAAYIYRYAKEEFGQDGVDRLKRNIGPDKNRTGRIIGLHAEPRLWNEYQKGLGDDTARVIAETAPGNKEAQDVGLDIALAKKSSDYVIREEMLRFLNGEQKDPEYSRILGEVLANRRAAAEQTLLSLKSLKAEEQGKIPTEKLIEVYGPDFLSRKPELLAMLEEATEENQRYQKNSWRDDPDLAASIRKEVQPIYDAYLAQKEALDTQQSMLDIFAPKPPPTPEEQAKVQETLTKVKTSLLGNKRTKRQEQGGAIINPLFKQKDAIKAITQNMEDVELQKAFQQFGRNVETQVESVRKLGIEKSLESETRRWTIFPQTIAENEPKFQSFIDTAKRGRELSMTIAHDLLQKGSAFIQQPNVGRMWEYAAAAREKGSAFQWTAENFQKIGATESEVKGLMALRDTMDSALPIYRDVLIKQGIEPEKAQVIVDEMQKSNYVPFSRFGDKFVQLNDPATGEQVYFAKFETDKQKNAALAKIEALKKQYPDKQLQVREGDFGENPESLFAANSANGFQQHLKPAQNVPGYQKNMKRAVSEYIGSLANFAAKAEMKMGFEQAYEALPKNSPKLAKYAQEYAQYQMSNEGEGSTARKVMTLWFLAGRVSSGVLNLTQQLTTTLPRAQAEVGTVKATQYWANSRKLLVERLIGGEASFAKKYPELDEAINTALKHGSISEQSLRELGGRARSQTGEVSGFDQVMDVGMFFFDAAEKSNRYHAFLTGYQIAKERGMSPQAATRYGEQFSDVTQFDYSKINRPKAARGKIGAPLSTFQLYKFNDIKFTFDLAKAALKGDGKAAQGLATKIGIMVALAGLAGAVPGTKEINKALESAGYDVRGSVRTALKDQKFLADMLDNGLPYAFGLPDISGSLSNEVLSLPTDFNAEGVAGTIGKVVGGVPLAMAGKVAETARLASQGEYMKAFQAGAPASLSAMAKAFEAASEGKVTNTRGQTIAKDPSLGEVGSMALGFTPSRSRKFYNDSRSLQIFDENAKDNDDINKKIAEARINKDRAEESRLRQAHAAKQKERVKQGYGASFPNPKAINDFILSMQDPIAAQMKRLKNSAKPEAQRRFGSSSLGGKQ